jgi:hypothetical protein
MTWIWLGTALLAGLGTGTAFAQAVPEGIHSDAEGPAAMCGLSGRDAADLIRVLRESPSHHRQDENSAQFEFYLSADEMDTWVFTNGGRHPAHPTITCRHVFQSAEGSWYQTREMRCDSDRAACDALFPEFQALDGQLRQALEGGTTAWPDRQ